MSYLDAKARVQHLKARVQLGLISLDQTWEYNAGIVIMTGLGSRAPFLESTVLFTIKIIQLYPPDAVFAALPERDTHNMIKFSFLASLVLMSIVIPALPQVSRLP